MLEGLWWYIWWPWCTAADKCGDFSVSINVTAFYSSLNIGVVQGKTWRLYAFFIILMILSKGMAPNLYRLWEHTDLRPQNMWYFLHSPHAEFLCFYHIFYICLFPSFNTPKRTQSRHNWSHVDYMALSLTVSGIATGELLKTPITSNFYWQCLERYVREEFME